jgi:hypothetical protein
MHSTDQLRQQQQQQQQSHCRYLSIDGGAEGMKGTDCVVVYNWIRA